MTISLLPRRGAFFGWGRLQWRPQKPIAIAGAKLATRNACRELYRHFVGNSVGSVISPLLANVYLHEVLDTWFETVVKAHCRGHVVLERYADDFLIGCKLEEDARRIKEVLPKRFAKYGLEAIPQKSPCGHFGKLSPLLAEPFKLSFRPVERSYLEPKPLAMLMQTLSLVGQVFRWNAAQYLHCFGLR